MATLIGIKDWSFSRDKEAYRDYSITFLVKVVSPLEGPFSVLNTPGLPTPGSIWNFQADFDDWAYCKYTANIRPYKQAVPNQYWLVDCTFSTKPDRRCNETQMENPILEPAKISGTFVKYTEEASQDRYGNPIRYSSFERIRGPQVEFDRNRLTLSITNNIIPLNYSLLSSFVDCVNQYTLWGMPPRTIKLSEVSFEQVFFGECYVYYRRTLGFDINLDTFDRNIEDESQMVLHGEWRNGVWVLTSVDTSIASVNPANPNPQNPLHFMRYQDANGNLGRIPLNGKGIPVHPAVASFLPNILMITQINPTTWTCPSTITLSSTVGMTSPGQITILDYNADGQPYTVVIDFTGIAGNTITGCTVANVYGNPDLNNSGVFTVAGDTSVNFIPPFPDPNQQGYIFVQKYDEVDFTLLGGLPLQIDPYQMM